ncbi:ig domain protein group 2 domain protein [Clostridium sp. CAG:508]|nr:ig domain protein group 2 domain protein [Clostridium sp. CAG:508]
MSKCKKILLLLTLMLIAIVGTVSAHSVDLDPESLISFPFIVSEGKGKITVKSSVTNYTLYYQNVEISNATYDEINTIKENGKAELSTIERQMNSLKEEYNNLKTIKDEKYTTYQNAISNNLTEEQINVAKTEYETANTNYTNKVKEYNTKVDEYNAKVSQINNQVKDKLPMYNDSNWTKTTDGSFKVNLTQFSGKKSFSIWAKLVTGTNTYYDQEIYSMNGTKPTEVSVTSVSLNKSTLDIKVGETATLTATINPTNATNKNVTWESDNTQIATVDTAGKVTAIKEGTAKITVKTKDGNYTATCIVTVSKNDGIVWTDPSNIKFTVTEDFYLKVTGLKEDGKYYGFISNGKIAPTVPDTGWIENENLPVTNKPGFSISKYLEKSGDIYVWIYETQIVNNVRQNKCIIEAQKIERPALKKIGTRMKCYFLNEETSTHLFEAYSYENARKINVKIGKVTDKSILRAIKNGETDCLQKLLDYAKNADSIYTGTVPLGRSESITNKLNLVNDEYYYVYMVLDDENGKYFPVEDVSLYQALTYEKDGKTSKNLFDYLNDNFKWNLGNDDTTIDNTTATGKLPQTGASIVIYVAITLVIVAGVIFAIKYKKYNIKY